jgi:hypothetical protein
VHLGFGQSAGLSHGIIKAPESREHQLLIIRGVQ